MQAVIFDMDGVIFDTEHLAMRLWIQAAQELGIPGIADRALWRLLPLGGL